MVAKAQQRSLIMVSLEPHVPATATVTAVGPTLGDVGLTAKTYAPRPTVSSFGV